MKIRTALLAAALATGALLGAGSPASAQVDAPAAGLGTYDITIRTGDLANAGTDDSVRITVFGDLGQSPPVQIDRDFRRNETATFGPYRWVNIGHPGYISLGKSGRESDAWFPEYVQIHDELNDAVYTCAVNQWFPQGSLTRFYGCS